MAEKKIVHEQTEVQKTELVGDKPVETTKHTTETNEISINPKNKKPIYKKPWFWIAIAGGLIVIGAIIFFVVMMSQQSKNKQIISDGWHELALESNNVEVLADKVTDQASYKAYSTELHKLDNLIDDKEFAAQKLAGNYADVQRYKGFLTDFNRYMSDAAKYSDDVAAYTDENNTSLTDLSKTALDAANNLKDNTSYLQDTMPAKIFDTQKVLVRSRDEVVAKAASDAAKKAQAAAQAAADAKNLTTVQANTNSFMTAYIAGNAAKMRQYMTTAFQNEYDFNQLTPEARAYSYPASYRIITAKKQDDGNYKVQVNVVFKNHTDSSQYTVGQEPTLNNVNGAWLINTIKEGSGY